MSAYKDFVHDFPQRCHSLLERFETLAIAEDRDVTLLIATATAGLVIPYERLSYKKRKENSSVIELHPIGDRARFKDTAAKVDELMSEIFSSTGLYDQQDRWRTGEVKSLAGEPDSWKDFDCAKLIESKQVGTVLRIIRNGLAHGNIWSRGDPIIELVIASEVRDPQGILLRYKYVAGSPNALKHLLIGWFKILERPDVDSEEALEILNESAIAA